MLDDLEKMQRAKMYIDKLANGIDPITGETMPSDTVLNNVRLARCFFYVSDILQQVIDSKNAKRSYTKFNNKPFYITFEQREKINIKLPICLMKDITETINENTINNGCKKFQSRWISQWLLMKGYIEEYTDSINHKHKIITPAGENIGLKFEIRNGARGNYKVIQFNKTAQNHVLENLDFIISTFAAENQTNQLKYQRDSWSPEHEEILIDLFNKEVPIYEIAVTLKRSELGIRDRLKILGLIKHSSDTK